MGHYEFVGVGKQMLGTPDNPVEGWCFTYEKAPADGSDIPDFHHHIMPAHIFSNAAQQFGLDLDKDWDEVFELVMHDLFAGDEHPDDSIDPPAPRGRAAAPQRLSAVGRRTRRRTERAKKQHTIVGLEAASARVKPERWVGIEQIEARIARLEAVRRRRNSDPTRSRGGSLNS